MAGAVDCVAGGTAEGVVETGQLEVVLPLVGAMAVEIVGVEVRDDTGGGGFGQVADAVIGHGDCRGRVGVGRRDELSRVIVGIVGDDAACPNAAR